MHLSARPIDGLVGSAVVSGGWITSRSGCRKASGTRIDSRSGFLDLPEGGPILDRPMPYGKRTYRWSIGLGRGVWEDDRPSIGVSGGFRNPDLGSIGVPDGVEDPDLVSIGVLAVSATAIDSRSGSRAVVVGGIEGRSGSGAVVVGGIEGFASIPAPHSQAPHFPFPFPHIPSHLIPTSFLPAHQAVYGPARSSTPDRPGTLMVTTLCRQPGAGRSGTARRRPTFSTWSPKTLRT